MPAGRLVCDPVAVESRGPLRLLLVPSRLRAAAKGGGGPSRGHRTISVVAARSRAPAPISRASAARAPSHLCPGAVTLRVVFRIQRLHTGPREAPVSQRCPEFGK